MLSEFRSAEHRSCARSYRRSIGAVISNVYAFRTAKPNWRNDIRAATNTQARCEASCCSTAEQLRGFDVSGPLQQKRPVTVSSIFAACFVCSARPTAVRE